MAENGNQRGFFLMPRGWQDHPAWRDEAFSRAQAWAWLIEEARWKPARVNIAGKTVELQRGELSHSIRFLAERWGWGKGVVERFIGRLKTETLIETRTETGQLVITIRDYDEMQTAPGDNGTPCETPGETQPGQDRDRTGTKKKESKELNERNEGENNKCSTDFAEWWIEYPNKVSRAKAEVLYLKAWRKVGGPVLLEGLRAYKRNKPDWQAWAHPTTWLRNERWNDQPAAIPPQPQARPQGSRGGRLAAAMALHANLIDEAERGADD